MLTIGWLILILSLFYDPISSILTEPQSRWSPLRINHHEYYCPIVVDANSPIDWGNFAPGTADPRCPKIQGRWVIERPYALGNRIFWTIVVAIAPGFLLIFGHGAWRRICPLSFLSQLPKALGWQQNRRFSDQSWLGRYHWLIQFGGLYLGLTLRLILVNSSRSALGIFLILTIVSAMVTGLLFKGKSWYHYLCPFAPVQQILTGTGGLLEKSVIPSRKTIPHSMCRTIDSRGGEVSACVGCKMACSVIDLGKLAWFKNRQF